jgi:hypothetical protein
MGWHRRVRVLAVAPPVREFDSPTAPHTSTTCVTGIGIGFVF